MTSFESNPLIVALDGIDVQAATELIQALRGRVWGFKLNDLLHDRNLQRLLDDAGDDVRFFFDCKLHDIPNTVANTVQRICDRRAPDLLTVHASGGPKMLETAVAAAQEVTGDVTGVLSVTVLTSLDAGVCQRVFNADPATRVESLARSAKEAGCFGMVCSPLELPVARRLGIRAVVPGVRPEWWVRAHPGGDDQARVATAGDAIAGGATALVIGRPIVRANDPAQAVADTLAEIRAAS